jgi:hypothetical protein
MEQGGADSGNPVTLMQAHVFLPGAIFYDEDFCNQDTPIGCGCEGVVGRHLLVRRAPQKGRASTSNVNETACDSIIEKAAAKPVRSRRFPRLVVVQAAFRLLCSTRDWTPPLGPASRRR